MQLSYGTPVVAAEGRQLGNLSELVVDPRHRMVTHLVVQSGLFFAHDRLISVEYIKHSDEQAIYLSITSQELEAVTAAFEHDQHLNLDDQEVSNRYGVGGKVWQRPLDQWEGAGLNSIVPPGIGPIPPEPEVVISSDDVGLEQGAQVVTSDGMVLGALQQCITAGDDRITHLLITEGKWFKESKTIPVDWVRKIEENMIFLGVPLSVVEKI